MSNKKMLQTQFSIRATDLAESFRNTVGKLRVGPYGYAPDMTAPEGPSTGGGVQAMQHVKLQPQQANMPILVVGHANQKDGSAELRTFEHVDAICRQRFQRGAPVDPAQYAQFLQAAQGFLAACGMRVAIAGPPRDLGSMRPGAPEPAAIVPKSNAALIVVCVTLVVLAALAVTALVVLRH